MPTAGWFIEPYHSRPHQTQTTQLLVKSRNDTAVTDVADRIEKAPATTHDQKTASSLTAKRKTPAAFKTNERHGDPPKRVNLENHVVVHHLRS